MGGEKIKLLILLIPKPQLLGFPHRRIAIGLFPNYRKDSPLSIVYKVY